MSTLLRTDRPAGAGRVRRGGLRALVPLIALLAAAAWPAPAAAQLPGWSFTPRLTLGGVYDDNVAVVSPGVGRPTQDDYLTLVSPGLQLDRLTRRSHLSLGYQGSFRAYRELRELNSYEQHSSAGARHAVSRRLTVRAGHRFTAVPTTDAAELEGVVFRRTGMRVHDAGGGFDAALSRRTALEAGYSFMRVDFDRDIEAFELLRGGHVHTGSASLGQRLSSRASAGGEYTIRLANLEGLGRELRFQHAGGTFAYDISRRLTVSGAAGLSWLVDNEADDVRVGPYVRAGLSNGWRRTTLSLGYTRSYIPTFGFGGTAQSQELRAGIRTSLLRNRMYLDGALTTRETDPLVAEELTLRSTWARGAIGYALHRWLRLEGYYQYTHQDTRVAGGRVHRNRVGVQMVTSRPMRLQ
jgi:hypothetical protein